MHKAYRNETSILGWCLHLRWKRTGRDGSDLLAGYITFYVDLKKTRHQKQIAKMLQSAQSCTRKTWKYLFFYIFQYARNISY